MAVSTREPLNIAMRRRAEDRLREAGVVCSEHTRLSEIADFERRSTAKVHGALMKKRTAEENERLRDAVDERRRALATLLTEERAAYEAEMEASFESPEVVKERTFAYARKLKEENEARRAALAAELEERRFRMGSDVLRARASAVTAERTALDRLAQLQEKAKLREMEAERERREAGMVDSTTARMFSRAAVEAEARRRLAVEMREALATQAVVKSELASAAAAHDRSVDDAMLVADGAAAAAARRAEVDRRAAARAEYERVTEYNAGEAAVKARAAAAEAAKDKADLAAAMAAEATTLARERATLAAYKAETMEHRKRLEEQMAVQAEDKGWVDKYYAHEADKEWEKRETTWRAEADARRGLMADVAATRVLQMEDRARVAAADAARDAAQVEAWKRARAAGDAREAAVVEARKAAAATHADALKVQLADREAARAAERQAAYLEWRLQQRVEKDYAARVEALLRDESPVAR